MGALEFLNDLKNTLLNKQDKIEYCNFQHSAVVTITTSGDSGKRAIPLTINSSDQSCFRLLSATQSSIVIEKAGKYLISAQTGVNSITAGDVCVLNIYKNNTSATDAANRVTGTYCQISTIPVVISCSSQDIITFYVANNSGGRGTFHYLTGSIIKI